MTWQDLLDRGRIAEHAPTKEGIESKRAVVARDLSDAKVKGVSIDNRFKTAYSAALMLAGVVINAAGYRTRGTNRHTSTFDGMELAIGDAVTEMVDELQSHRLRRHETTYGDVDLVTEEELDRLIGLIENRLQPIVTAWLDDNHPDLA